MSHERSLESASHPVRPALTDVVQGLGARGVVPQRLPVELRRLLVVAVREHRVAFVRERRRVVPVRVHGQVRVAAGLREVVLLSEARNTRQLPGVHQMLVLFSDDRRDTQTL